MSVEWTSSDPTLRNLVAQLPFPAWLLDRNGHAHGNAEAHALLPASADASTDPLLGALRQIDGSAIEDEDSPFLRCLQTGERVEVSLRPANGSASLRVAAIPLEGADPDAAALVVAERPGPASLADWLNDVGHALRSPLSPIRTAAQLLRNPRIDADQRDGLLEIVERQIRELMARIDELADLVRIKRDAVRAERRPCDLSMLLDIVRGRVAARFEEEERHLQMAAVPADVAVLVDQSQLVQAFAQVLMHAMRHTPAGATVSCAVDDARDSVTIRVRDFDQHAGPGHAGALLSPPVDRHGAGLGAALYLAEAFVERSGGRFEATARTDAVGMEFAITLPRVEAAAAS